MLILWAIVFLLAAIGSGFLAFGGIAIAISFFAKVFFFIALVCFLIFISLIIAQKIKSKSKEE